MMVLRKFLIFSMGGLLSVMLTAPVSAGSNLVMDGGFETGGFADWALSGNLSDLSVGNSPNAPHSGNYAVEIGEVGSPGFISQDLATTSGGTYSLSFWIIGGATAGPPNLFEVTWGGTTLLDLVDYVAPTSYTEYQFSGLTASSNSTTLEFGFQQNPSFTALDDISVVANAVPEPSSMVLACIAGLTLSAASVSRLRHRSTS